MKYFGLEDMLNKGPTGLPQKAIISAQVLKLSTHPRHSLIMKPLSQRWIVIWMVVRMVDFNTIHTTKLFIIPF